MVDVLEYSDVLAEIKGAMCSGKLKFTEQNIVFKNNRTGKVEQISSSDLDLCNWQKLVGNWGLRLFLKNGTLHRFTGFKESEIEKLAKYFKTKYSNDLLEKELSVKGWNWGTAKFTGSVLNFDINNLSAFEIPLNNVSQCTTGKNEVTVEFHQNDDAPVSLMEMRFHIPTSENAGDDPVDSFHKQVMLKASVISVIGDAIAIFREIQCLTPRGRYDIKIFQSFFQLHGKTFDYKIPMATVLRLFVLPHKDGRQNFLVVSLDPPIKQGQTRYHYLVFLFAQDEDTSIELPFTEEELQEKYEGKLTKELSGPTFDVISRIMKTLVNRKITVPGAFVGHSGTPAIGCSYKAAAGYLYPLERGFIYIHKPPIHIRFEEISSVNFARSGGSTRSFDFEIELKSGVIHTFSSIEKEEYGKLFDFISLKKLHVKNRGKSDKPNYGGSDDFGNSDEENEPDAYLARVKREAQERDEEDGGSSDDDSTDEDFKPAAEESDVAEEYDSNPTPTDSDADSDASSGEGGGEGDASKEKKKKKSESKPKKSVTVSEKPHKKRKKKKDKDENRPKRPPSAYMLWFNENREKIKTDNPGISFTDIAKKGGELWKKLDDKSEWEKKCAKLKEEYQGELSQYKAKVMQEEKKNKSEAGGGSGGTKKKTDKSSLSPTKAGSGGAYISKEFIEDTDSSSDSDAGKKDSGKKPQVKKEESKSDVDSETDTKKSAKPSEKLTSKASKKKKSDESSSGSEDESAGKGKNSKKGKKDDDDDDEDESEEILSTPTASESESEESD